jgi:RNA polymerase sigma-70 factor, ECF subfamily
VKLRCSSVEQPALVNLSTDVVPSAYLDHTFLEESRQSLFVRSRRDESEDEDLQLIGRTASGDESALAAIYDRHAGSVYSLLRRILRDESAAEEILQDVFFHLWKIATRFNPERGALRAWLLVIARNRALSHLRRRVQDDPNGLDEQQLVSAALPQDTAAAQSEIVEKVRNVLAQLPPEQCELFELAYFSGMTHSEIAERTGQPLGTVKTRLRTALTSLRRAIQ